MKEIKRKYFLAISIFIICISINIIAYGKYILDKSFTVAEIDLDRERPVISTLRHRKRTKRRRYNHSYEC